MQMIKMLLDEAEKEEGLQMPKRQRFLVELRAGETTVISWKRLVKDKDTTSIKHPQHKLPALEARISPEACIVHSQLQKDGLPPPANRFSAVIEKIERLYKGTVSSDEEEFSDIPDDDQYDTEDSFIDDEELDEYFSVDKSKTRHNGFFINKGKLERVNEPAPLPVHVPKKRKKKDMKKVPGDKHTEQMPKKLLKVGGVRMKTAARSGTLVGLNDANSGQGRTSFVGSENSIDKTRRDHNVRVMQNQTSTVSSGLPEADIHKENINKEETSLSAKASQKYVAKPSPNVDEGKAKHILLELKDRFSKGAKLVASTGGMDLITLEGNNTLTGDFQERKNNKDARGTTTNKFQTKKEIGKGADSRDINISGNKSLPSKIKSLSSAAKEVDAAKPKGSIMLERAIQELENIVTELRPPTMDVQEQDQSVQGVKRRLPAVVKLKLAKVAILAVETNQGKISDGLIDRLMRIVGHIIQLKTLKRNLKEMIESEKSTKQEKESRLQEIKREVAKMVKIQMDKKQECSSDDFQQIPDSREKGTSCGLYKWDKSMEDLLYKLYDHYIEEMDESRGSKIKKFYGEVVELWPKGYMDNSGIRHALYRAKERRKRLANVGKDLEKAKNEKVSIRPKIDKRNENGIVANESNVNLQTQAPYDKHIEVQETVNVSVNVGSAYNCKIAKISLPSITDEKRKSVNKSFREEMNIVKQWNNKEAGTIIKKKMKRKQDVNMKISFNHGKKMQKVGKQVHHASSISIKGSSQVAGVSESN